MTVRNAVAKQEQPGVGALVDQYRGDFTLVLPTHIKADQWIRVAQGVLRRDPKLAKVAKANPGSLLSALLRCAHLGLEPGDTYHLVPFANEIVGITDYTGEIELIYRAGAVIKVEAQVVHAKDHFEYRPGDMDRPVHEADWFADRGPMIGVYAYGVFESGAVSRVVLMGEAEIERVKLVSKTAHTKDSPWQQWPDRMWLKTAVKQLRKWVPSSAEYRSEVLRSEAAVTQVTPDLPVLDLSDDEPYGELDTPAADPETGEVIEATAEPEYAADDPARPM